MGDYLLSHAIVMATGGSGVWVGEEETVGMSYYSNPGGGGLNRLWGMNCYVRNFFFLFGGGGGGTFIYTGKHSVTSLVFLVPPVVEQMLIQ